MGQALYRKHRPKSLGEVVGQEHVTTTLANALKAGRVSHAYLLCGPRGTGKTSIARILAHEINGLPYGDEAHLDIIEIDAASNRRIDEIRDLRDRVSTAPSAAKYKVYIIDEVHMLTKEAFNALLKTLEEPPAHVVFILATTEAHKLPETIISRTQRYTLRPVPEEQVVAHLKAIAKAEKLTVDDDALALIAKHGDGTFRDSISLLDQASSISEHVTKADVERMLGLAPEEYISRLATAVGQGDSAGVVATLGELYGQGYEPAMVSHQLGEYLRRQVLDGTAADAQASLALLEKLLDVPAARSPRQLLELVLLQAALPATSRPMPVSGAGTPRSAPTSAVEAKKGVSAPHETKRENNPNNEALAKAQPPTPESKPDLVTDVMPREAEEASQGSGEDPSIPADASSRDDATNKGGGPLGATDAESRAPAALDVSELWQQALDAIKKQYNTLYGIARMAQPTFDGQQLTLSFKFAFHQKRLNEAKNRKIFSDIVSKLHGSAVEIVCIVAEAAAPAEGKAVPDVSAISNIFGGAEVIE